MRPGEGGRFGPGECGVWIGLLFFSLGREFWMRERSTTNNCRPKEWARLSKPFCYGIELSFRRKRPARAGVAFARPGSAFCTRTGRGKKRKLHQTSRPRLGLRYSIAESFQGSMSQSGEFFHSFQGKTKLPKTPKLRTSQTQNPRVMDCDYFIGFILC